MLQKQLKEKIYKMFELNPSKKVILFFGGGEFGLGKDRTVQVLEAFIKKLTDFQIVAVAGKNEKMKESFEELVKNNQAEDRVRVLGFTDKVPELMNISCLVVSKPGGLTTTESLASNLPMIIINPIPGQEEENAEFLESKGAGIWLRSDANPDEIIDLVFNIICDISIITFWVFFYNIVLTHNYSPVTKINLIAERCSSSSIFTLANAGIQLKLSPLGAT